MYTFDKDIEMTASQKQSVLNIIDSEVKFTYNDKVICEAYPQEVSYCKKALGQDYQEVLIEMLTTIDTDIDKAIKILCDKHNKPCNDKMIPRVVSYEMQEYIDDIVINQTTNN